MTLSLNLHKTAIAFVAVSYIMIPCNAQILTWAKHIGGNGNEFGNHIASDNNGNVFTTGSFSETVDFDPGAGTNFLSDQGYNDAFLFKQNAAGELLWAKQIASPDGEDVGMAVTTDNSGNVYLTGYFEGTVDLDPGNGNLTYEAISYPDIFVCKFDSDGNLIWGGRIGGDNSDLPESIVVDDFGNVYLTGTFSSTCDFDPGTDTFNLTASGNHDGFVCKLDNEGMFQWAKPLSGSGTHSPSSLVLDIYGNVYYAGTFIGEPDFDPGDASSYILSSPFDYNVFVSKLNADGNFEWAKQFGGSVNDFCYCIECDAEGNILLGGSFGGTADFDPDNATYNLISSGNDDGFICKLSEDGAFLWAKQIGGIYTDRITSLKTDALTNLYFTGDFMDQIDLITFNNSGSLTSSGNVDVLLGKLETSGSLIWMQQIGGSEAEYSYALTLDAAGSIGVTGQFEGTCNFDLPDTGSSLTAIQNADMFVCKYDDGVTHITDQTSKITFSVYPNPAADLCFIDPGQCLENVSVIIFSANGETVYSSDFKQTHFITIDTSQFAEGIYSLEIKSSDTVSFKQLIIGKKF